jgi:hypothetical protein
MVDLGEALVKRYDESWDRPHRPGPQDLWQESDWLTFYDPVSRVGGIYRIGQEPNRRKGQPNLFVFALGGQRYLMRDLGGRGADCDLTDEDRWQTGYRAAGNRVDALGSGRVRFRWDYPETEADLEFGDSHYEPRDWSMTNKGGEIIATLNADGHLECAGRLRGRVRIGQSDHTVDCFAHRDRSWGYREHYMVKMKRAFGAWGTTGSDFSFAMMRLELKSGEILTTGFVNRDGRGDDIADARLITTLDADFLSPIAGAVLLTLENGEAIRIECDIAQAHGGFAPGTSFNSVGTFSHGGKVGFCDYSATANPGGGDQIASQSDATLVALEAGLSRSAEPSWTLAKGRGIG